MYPRTLTWVNAFVGEHKHPSATPEMLGGCALPVLTMCSSVE